VKGEEAIKALGGLAVGIYADGGLAIGVYPEDVVVIRMFESWRAI
jgi:hypothetical protein